MHCESRFDKPCASDRWADAGAVATLTAAVAAVSYLFQRQIAVNDGRGWDGSHYFAVAEQVALGVRPNGAAPFVHRILVPALAGLFGPADVLTGFRIINVVAILVVITLMTVWLRMHFRARWVRLTLIVLFLAQWTGPVRTFFWYPVLVDYWFTAAILAGLLVVERLRAGGRAAVWVPVLCLVSTAAVAVREIGLLIPLAALFSRNPLTGPVVQLRARLRDLRTVPRALLLPPLLAVLALAGIRSLAVVTGGYSTVRSAGYWLLNKSPLAYLLGWFISYGPVLALPLLYGRESARYLREHQGAAALLVGVLGVSWIGGNDTERFVTWAAPVVYVLVGIAMLGMARDRVHPLAVVLLALAQAVAARLFWVVPAAPLDAGSIPELVVLTPIGNDVSVFDLTAWDAAPAVRVLTAVEYAVLCGLLAGVVWTSRRRLRAAS